MNKLRTWRLERGLSQLELADASQVKRWAIQLAEAGLRLPTIEEQAALATTLGIEIATVFPGGTDPDSKKGA